MKKIITVNRQKISYNIKGKGNAIVLIHGFLETSNTWCKFGTYLSDEFTVIEIDLPGHGESSNIENSEGLEKYAKSIKLVLDFENIKKAVLVGHSMGGYTALAFAESYMEMLSGLCLFHSHPFAENKDKRKLRDSVIEQIKNGNKNEICKDHAPKVYAPMNIKKFDKQIKTATELALNISEEAIIKSITSMRDRNDTSELFSKLKIPTMYIIGKHDQFIPMSILEEIKMPENSKTFILNNSGHMGSIEEEEKSNKIIRDFAKKCF